MFYVNTDTKLFIAAPQSDSPQFHAHNCLCGDQNDKPLFLSTCQRGSASCKKINKPVIYNYATNVLQFTFLDNEGLPYDLTDCTLALAVDNTFSHSDSLIALADGDVLSPLDAVVEFKVSKFSKKFAQILKSGIPASQIWMQITAYKKNGEQNVLLQDRGIRLATKLLLNEGLTQDNLLNFYNKQQIDAFMMDLGRYQLIPGKVIITQSSNSDLQSGSLYIDRFNHDFYLEVSDSLVYLGNLDKSDYYTKQEVQQIATALSDSISTLKQQLHENYYTKIQTDTFIQQLSNSIASVKSSLNNYYTIEQTDQLLDTKASNSYVQQINQQIQDLKQLRIVQRATPQQGFAATYQLKDHNNNTLGVPINIIKDKFLSDVKLIVASQQDLEVDSSVIIGDPYLKFIFNTQPATTVYVAVKSLVDVYDAGQGIKLQNNTFSVESDQQTDSVKFLQIGQNTIGLKGITSAVDKVLSDAKGYTDDSLQNYYTKSQVNIIAGTLSNSITAIKQELHGNYYTSTKIDQIIDSISDSIAAVKSTFSSYYTKPQVDALVVGLSNSVDLSDYYTKAQVDALIAGLSNSTDLNDYYTKVQIDQITVAISNSIAAVKSSLNNYYNKTQIDGTFSGYYTKPEVDALVAGLSNSNDLSNYYTKSQVNALIVDYCKVDTVSYPGSGTDPADGLYTRLEQMLNGYPVYRKGATDYYLWSPSGSDWIITDTDPQQNLDEHILFANNGTADLTDWPEPISVTPVKASDSTVMSNYYTKSQIDTLFQQFSNSVDLSNYYTKSQVDSLIQNLSNSLTAVKDSFQNYYTSTQVDQIAGTLDNSIQEVKGSLQEYYNKGQVDAIAGTLSNSIAAVKSTLSSYYTSAQVEGKLQGYYTKSQMEGFLGSLSDSIEAVKSTFSQYYNKGEVEAFISALSDSLEALDNKITQQKNYNNLTNKPSIAGVTLQGNLDWSAFGLPQFVGSYLTFSAVDANNQYTINGTTTVPVAVLTGANHIYLIQKGSLIVDTNNDALIFDATPYMAYDDMQIFTGTWRLYFAAATVPSGDLIVGKTGTSIVPQHNIIIKHTLSSGDTFPILTSQLTSSRQVTFQLHLIQPSTAVSFTLPSELIWPDYTNFKSGNTVPQMSQADTEYCIVIRWDGQHLLANLAYTKYLGA